MIQTERDKAVWTAWPLFPVSIARYYGIEAEFLHAPPVGGEELAQFVQTGLGYLAPGDLPAWQKTRDALVVGKILAQGVMLEYPQIRNFRVTPAFDDESNLAPFAYAWILAAGTTEKTFVGKGPHEPIPIHIHHQTLWYLPTWGARFRNAVHDASINLGMLGGMYTQTTPREIIHTIATA